MKRWEVINKLIENKDYFHYLEIGTQNEICLAKVKCEVKIGVDPKPLLQDKKSCNLFYRMTSDEFFRMNENRKKPFMFDIIFIDGLHHFRQVFKDTNNSLRYLNPKGTIILHDCNPQEKIHQDVPRVSKHWNGDVWKAFVKFRGIATNYITCTIDTDEGLGFIQKTRKEIKTITPTEDWETFSNNKQYYLNLITTEQWEKRYL